jgi:hypothetical protein
MSYEIRLFLNEIALLQVIAVKGIPHPANEQRGFGTSEERLITER